ncbi:TIGR00374 family protein, partial [Streptomyces albogriseolus]
MKQQGVHPEDAEETSAAASRPDTARKAASAGRNGEAEPSADAGGPPRARASEAGGTPDPECGDVTHVDEVEGDEPLLPARVHRPSDLMRLLVGVLAVVVLLAVAAFAHGTTSGLEQDINKGTG